MGAFLGVFVERVVGWVLSLTVVKLPPIFVPLATVMTWLAFLYVICFPVYRLTAWATSPSRMYLTYLHLRRVVLQRLGLWRRQ
jgi:hypothetical protein